VRKGTEVEAIKSPLWQKLSWDEKYALTRNIPGNQADLGTYDEFGHIFAISSVTLEDGKPYEILINREPDWENWEWVEGFSIAEAKKAIELHTQRKKEPEYKRIRMKYVWDTNAYKDAKDLRAKGYETKIVYEEGYYRIYIRKPIAETVPDPDKTLYFGEKEKLALSTIGGEPPIETNPEALSHGDVPISDESKMSSGYGLWDSYYDYGAAVREVKRLRNVGWRVKITEARTPEGKLFRVWVIPARRKIEGHLPYSGE